MKVITANRLLNGDVVWLAETGPGSSVFPWRRFMTARKPLPQLWQKALRPEKNQKVVGVYEMDVTVEDGVIVPVRLREKIRATGPTTHPELGKQPRPFPPETTQGRAAPSMAAPAEERLRHVPLRRI